MKKTHCLLAFLLVCIIVRSQTQDNEYQPGRLYVKIIHSAAKQLVLADHNNIPVAATGLEKALSSFGVTRISRPFYTAEEMPALNEVIRVDFAKTGATDELLGLLERDPLVEYAERVPMARTHSTPNDPLYSAATHLQQINAPAAWNIFNGNSNITVAIIDNAVMWNHADLVANTYTNAAEAGGTTGVDDDNNGYVDDINGWDAADQDNNPLPPNTGFFHGTHCAGIAGARTDNGIGVASIGWNIKIIPVKCEPNTGSSFSVTNGYEGIIYASRAGARIISCSWGSSSSSTTEQLAIDYAWNRGAIIMASAGNNGTSAPNYPGAYNNVYCVAAVDASDVKYSLSSYGTWVDISAPGVNIESTMPYTGTPAYSQQSGTSMSTPMVAGLAALMLSKSPNMTRADVLNCISNTAVNISTVSGNSGYGLGAGRIDAFAAMTCAATYSALPPVANFYAFPLNTCPNTPVQFYDSSLYVPTSWSWVFQGGSPATSTLANPTVSWSTAGTYSVMLTATNANGSSIKTKLAYITVAGPVALPLTEGFQGTQFLPAGWTANNIWNDNLYWQRVTGVGGFGTSTACAMFDNYTMNAPFEHDEMRTPKYSFSNVAVARLRFDVAYARYNATFSDSLEVRLSTNCGATWTTIYAKGGSTLATAPDASSLFIPTSSQWRRDSIDISTLAAGQSNVMFSFINRGHYGQPIYVDNINIFTPAPVVNFQLPSACAGSAASYTNTTTGATTYTWSFQGASPPVSILSSPTVTYSSAGVFTVALAATNGTATTSKTYTITVYAFPTLSVANATVCSGASATLGVSGASTYSWTGGGAGSTLIVTPPVTSVYTVTGTNGICSSTATAQVQVLPSPTLSAAGQTVCSGSTVTLSVTGAGSYLWNTTATSSAIAVSPSVNTTYTVTGTTGACSASIAVPVVVTSALSVSISASPSVLCSAGSVTLSASGANTYTWSSGATSSVVVISPTANSVYSVSGSSGNCSGNAALTVSVGTSPALSISASSWSVCAGGNVTLTASGAPLYSWSTGSTSAVVILSPMQTQSVGLTATDNGCSTSSVVTIIVYPAGSPECATGIAENGTDEPTVFPNPGDRIINVKAGGLFCCRLLDMQGRLIMNATGNNDSAIIDISTLAAGIYHLVVDSEGHNWHYRVVKE